MDLWPESVEDAKKVQNFLRKRLKITPISYEPTFVCGLDAAFSGSTVCGCASLFKFPEMIHVEDSLSKVESNFPYIPSYLSFREGKALVKAIEQLKTKPDVLLFDGHGIAHPLQMGIASHIGILVGFPSIGCAKSKLLGEYVEPGAERGSFTFLRENEIIIGAVLRTRAYVKPVFVSVGHLVDLFSSIYIVMKCCKGFRIPEPIRRAHYITNMILKKE